MSGVPGKYLTIFMAQVLTAMSLQKNVPLFPLCNGLIFWGLALLALETSWRSIPLGPPENPIGVLL